MNDNPFVTDSEDSPYLKHHYQEKNWYRGKDVLDVNYFMVDPETILLGWGAYTKEKVLRDLEEQIKMMQKNLGK